MEKYRILPHPSDGKFRAFGATLEEAFVNAALGTVSLMWDWISLRSAASFPVRARGRDLEQLLYQFLEEILFLFETRNFLLASVEDMKIEKDESGFRLQAVFRGDDAKNAVEIFGVVKAITYNEMKIEEDCGGWSIQVVVDM
jgi:SHS2 domain-containing protein